MAWTNSKIFRPMVADVYGNVAAFDYDADTIKAAAFNNTPTPNQDVTSANSAYNAGEWLVAREVIDTLNTNWVAGGRALTTKTVNSASAGVVFFTSDAVTGAGNVTMSGFFGLLLFDDTLAAPVADQGSCFIYLGGTQTVTNGTVTITPHANGWWRWTF